ncbi:hypothetical protein ABZP36_011169 [Zizania latifolia]
MDGMRLQEEGWVVCRAFKKRTMHPPRSSLGAWEPSYSYHDRVLVGAEHFKREDAAERDGGAGGGATALLHYSSSLAELPQLESPPLPSQGCSQGASAVDREEYDDSRRPVGAAVTTDWRALDKFVASQLSTEEQHHTCRGLQEYCKTPGAGNAGDDADADADMAALLLLDGDGQEEDTGRWLGAAAGLLSAVADAATNCGLGTSMPAEIN